MTDSTLEDAFWQRVSKPDTGCWEWSLSVGNHGYGQFTYRQQKYTAHRLAWVLTNGPIQDDLCVLHKCDNRRCANPNHLFLGTRADNLEDMTVKGRRASGSSHGRAKLNDADVLEIRASSELQRVIAGRYGVSPSAISLIKSGRHWRQLV